jgi:integrase
MQYFTTVRKRRRAGRQEWTARLIYKDEVTGLRKEKSRSAESQSQAKRLEKELEEEFLAGGQTTIESDGMTFEQLSKHCEAEKYCAAEYDDEGRKLLGVADTSVYEAHLKHFREFFGKMKIREIKLVHLRGYRNHRLRTKTKRGTNVTVDTVNREMRTLCAMLNEAKRNDWILVNPFGKGRPGELIPTAEEHRRETILSWEEEQRLLKACEGDDRRHLYALVIAALDTGARRGELLKLTWSKVAFDEGVIKNLVSYKGKNGAMLTRDAPLTARLRVTLLDLNERRPDKVYRPLKSGDLASESLVFGVSRSVKRSWNRARKAADLTHVRFHDLRHTTATRLAETLNLVFVGKVLGHSNQETTGRYINPDRELILQAGAILDRWQHEHRRLSVQEGVELTSESEAVN